MFSVEPPQAQPAPHLHVLPPGPGSQGAPQRQGRSLMQAAGPGGQVSSGGLWLGLQPLGTPR